MIGFSWGAWLSLILAAQYPYLVSRLILIGCGPLEEKYVPKIMETRLSRLSEARKRRPNASLRLWKTGALPLMRRKTRR